MRILIACEFSGIVREAFKKKGWDSWSCDILPSEIPGQHILDDVLNHLDENWDLMIAFPPCTHLSLSGQRWFVEGKKDYRLQNESIAFVEKLWDSDISKIAIENPIGILSTRSKLSKPAQIIQPYQFGETSQKSTCLWLKNLPKLKPTDIKEPEFVITKSGRKWTKWFSDTSKLPSAIRGKERSRTFIGIANAMAEQWTLSGVKK